ncbi:uncharacterized protein G2W53_035753 [Senna tora]|uniref:Uncharacterized protein n=1 Tax=Senna tora TaxID=362788 RepID=A0A834SUK9_9FABA|nr:uncharacterized protein G2W53_035753 [Senna tora]
MGGPAYGIHWAPLLLTPLNQLHRY